MHKRVAYSADPGKTASLGAVLSKAALYVRKLKPIHTVKLVLNDHSKKRQKYVFKTGNCLMQVRSILQYFQPTLNYHLF